MTNFCQTCGGQKGLHFSTLPGCTCTTAVPFYYPIQSKREWFDCTDAQLIDEVRRRGFVIRDAQIEQVVECMCGICKLGKREWVGLTDEEKHSLVEWAHPDIIEAIELKLKERNT
jgi:hypothetical protein